MTTKQRAKIYRKAAEIVYEGFHPWACHAIEKAAFGNLSHYTAFFQAEAMAPDFPEFAAMRPNENNFFGWWAVEEREPRILALLLCEQMCLNP